MNMKYVLFLIMSFAITVARRTCRNLFKFRIISRAMCGGGDVKDSSGKSGGIGNFDFDSTLDRKSVAESTLIGGSSEGSDDDEEDDSRDTVSISPRRRFFEDMRFEVDRVVEVLQQDGLGFDTKMALNELGLRVSNYLVREVLIRILRSINHLNKDRCARLGFKFFVWSGQQDNCDHTTNTYNLLMKIFADCKELEAMWGLLDEMTEKCLPTTARTFNILLCSCGEAGMARKLVEKFIKSRTFNFRPYKHSFNAILHSLLVINQYRLIEWVYDQMILEKHSSDILTYNILMCTKYRLGKLDQLDRLWDEMLNRGFLPDLHTYNILLHVNGERNKPLKALNLLNHMKEVGCEPRVIHFTSLIDGLSRAGNMEACRYFFDEMVKKGYLPDVVCYTVIITGYVLAREFENAQAMFNEMITKGQLPNVYTYNAMIRGLCIARRFGEARSMLREMESRGCNPNFVVYSTLVGNLRKAGRRSEFYEVIREMAEKGYNIQALSKFEEHRRC